MLRTNCLRLRLVGRRSLATLPSIIFKPSIIHEELNENKELKYRSPMIRNEVKQENDNTEQVEINQEVMQRLEEVYSFFSDGRRSFKAPLKTFDFYNQQDRDTTFVDDLMTYPLLNTELISYIIWNYEDSTSMRQMILTDLFQLVHQGNYTPVLKFLKIFGQAKRASMSVVNMVGFVENQQGKILENELQSLLCNAILRLALQSGETVLSISFIFQMHERKLKVSKTMISLICKSLCVPNKTQEVYNAFFLLKLIQHFPLFKYLAYSEAMHILDYLASKPHLNTYAYLFYNKVIQRYTKLKEKIRIDLYFGGLFRLVSQNIQVLNIKRANGVWLAWKDILVVQDNKTIDFNCIIKLIEANESDPQNQLKIIESIPQELIDTNERLFDYFVKFYGTHYLTFTNEFDDAVKGLTPPLRRLTVSLLFLSFLSQNNEVGSERLLQMILKSPNGLNKNEFEAIINKLILQGSVEQCIKMCTRTDAQVSSLGCVRVLRHLLLYEKNDSLKQEFLPIVISKFNQVHDDDSLRVALTETIFTYISDKISNRSSRSLFTRLYKAAQDKQMNRACGDSIRLQKYGLPNELVRFLNVEQDPVRILRVILDFGIVEEDIITLEWIIDQMRFQNVSTRDIVAYVINTNEEFASTVFVEDLIASCK